MSLGEMLWGIADLAVNAAGDTFDVMTALASPKDIGAVPVLGDVADGIGGTMGVVNAYNAYATGGVHSDDFWTGIGQATDGLGSLALDGLAVAAPGIGGAIGGLAGSLGGPVGTGLGAVAGAEIGADVGLGLEAINTAWGAGQAVADTAGLIAKETLGDDAGFSADEMMGGWLRGMVGDESIGWGAAEAANDAVGGGALGMLAGGAVDLGANLVTAPLNAADTMLGGVVDWVGNAADSDNVDEDYWGDAKSALFAGLY
jgi:hypothetical protein